jgi:hypothetical protein
MGLFEAIFHAIRTHKVNKGTVLAAREIEETDRAMFDRHQFIREIAGLNLDRLDDGLYQGWLAEIEEMLR